MMDTLSNGVVLRNAIYYCLTLNDFSKYSMFSIEPGGFFVGNKELASIGFGSGIGHRENTGATMGQISKLIDKLIAGPSRSSGGGITLLES